MTEALNGKTVFEAETTDSGLEVRPMGEGRFAVFDPAPGYLFDERSRGQVDVVYTDPVTRIDLVVFTGTEVEARSYAEIGEQVAYTGTQAAARDYVAEADARLRSFFVPALIILSGVVVAMLAAVPRPIEDRRESPIVMR